MAAFFLEIEFGRYRPASYDPTIPMGERKTHRIEGIDCAARRAARAFLAEHDRVGGRMYPRARISVHVRRQLVQSTEPTRRIMPLYESG